MHEGSRAELVVGGHRLEHAWHGPLPGEAPTLVFLHEGLGSVSPWRDFPRRLAESVSETRAERRVKPRPGAGPVVPTPRATRRLRRPVVQPSLWSGGYATSSPAPWPTPWALVLATEHLEAQHAALPDADRDRATSRGTSVASAADGG